MRSFFINLAAIALGAVFFAAAFPNLLFENGLPLLAWVAYIPVFWVIKRSPFKACIFWGALYGYAAYGLFNYWLSVFHPLAGLIVGLVYLVYLAFLFPLLKLALVLFPKRGYILQFLLWMAFEYLRTQGFLGYPYGITGYSQWRLIPVIQIASVTGVWGVSALVIFPAVWIAAALPGSFAGGNVSAVLKQVKESAAAFLRREKISAALWGAALAAALVFGFVFQFDYSAEPRAKIALVQHNTDPWRGGIEQYRQNYRVLKRLSDEAIEANPDLDLVVWSETAFVPRIYWHTNYRDDPPSWDLIRDLLAYLSSQEIPFVIGNDDARKILSGNRTFTIWGKNYTDSINQIYDRYGSNFNIVSQRNTRLRGFLGLFLPKGVEVTFTMDDYRVDYNAVMLFDRGNIEQLYRKLHLVPFTEHFPFEKPFPGVHYALINADTHFWETGTEAVVFDSRGIKFSTPICFEDTFGYLSRDFVRNGAELIVNLSNDAWSASLPAQMQHLSMAVFRSVENRRAMVRSTASGQTCAVDPNGRVIAMAEPFVETWLAAEVPLVNLSSLYTRYGDWLAKTFVGAALLLLIAGIVSGIMRKLNQN
jgi:apolipoprotein N-acyltransferase